MSERLPRLDLRLLAWAAAATVLAVAAGLLVGVDPSLAFDVAAICLAAAFVRAYPFASLVAILIARAALPNSVLIGFLALGAGAVALVVTWPRLGARKVTVAFFALLAFALLSVPASPSLDEGYTPA